MCSGTLRYEEIEPGPRVFLSVFFLFLCCQTRNRRPAGVEFHGRGCSVVVCPTAGPVRRRKWFNHAVQRKLKQPFAQNAFTWSPTPPPALSSLLLRQFPGTFKDFPSCSSRRVGVYSRSAMRCRTWLAALGMIIPGPFGQCLDMFCGLSRRGLMLR